MCVRVCVVFVCVCVCVNAQTNSSTPHAFFCKLRSKRLNLRKKMSNIMATLMDTPTNTHTHMHTHTNTHTHTHTHRHTHSHSHTLSLSLTHTHTQAHTHTQSNSLVLFTFMSHTHTRTHTHTRARTHARTHMHTRTLTHTCAHNHTHTHTQIHTYSRKLTIVGYIHKTFAGMNCKSVGSYVKCYEMKGPKRVFFGKGMIEFPRQTCRNIWVYTHNIHFTHMHSPNGSLSPHTVEVFQTNNSNTMFKCSCQSGGELVGGKLVRARLEESTRNSRNVHGVCNL